MVNFGAKLKELRLQSGMTQKELAAKLDVTKSVVSYYELSERYPSPEVLRQYDQDTMCFGGNVRRFCFVTRFCHTRV